MAEVLHPIVTLTPGTGSRDYDVKVGFDDNDDKSLEISEIDRLLTVHVLKLEWKVASTNQDGSTPIDMFGGESINYEATVRGTTPTPLAYTINEKHPDGSDFTAPQSGGNDLVVNFIPEPVPSADPDHHYSFPTSYSITIGGHTLKSSTVEMEIYALWINSFRDDATGKEWEVSVGDSIAFDAVGPTSATAWRWDMEDGVPDAWNPIGGTAKSGTGMVIPFSDEQRASNSWFGDTYGTVTVYCTSGLGKAMKLNSSDMNPTKKAKVFFDPAKTVDGNQPDSDKPPAWFVFWQQTGAGNRNVTYDNSLGADIYGETIIYRDPGTNEVTSADYPRVGPAASGPSQVGLTQAQINGIDTFHMTVRHEMLHYSDAQASIGAPNPDGDGIASSLEADTDGNGTYGPGETDPTLYSTHGSTPSGPSDLEYRAYWREGNVWNVEIGSYDSVDWSKGGKQW